MRISDWSSDVCSSDLPAHDCRFRLFDIERRVAIVCREYPIPTFPLRHPVDQLHNIPLAVPQCERPWLARIAVPLVHQYLMAVEKIVHHAVAAHIKQTKVGRLVGESGLDQDSADDTHPIG